MDIFIHIKTGARLEKFYKKIYSLFDIEEIKEGDSANHPPYNRYYVGYGSSINYKLWDDDSETLEEFPYILSVKENTFESGKSNLPNDLDEIAKILYDGGITTFIPDEDNYWDIDWNKKGKINNPDK